MTVWITFQWLGADIREAIAACRHGRAAATFVNDRSPNATDDTEEIAVQAALSQLRSRCRCVEAAV